LITVEVLDLSDVIITDPECSLRRLVQL